MKKALLIFAAAILLCGCVENDVLNNLGKEFMFRFGVADFIGVAAKAMEIARTKLQ